MNATTAKHTPGPWEISPKDQMRVNIKAGTFLHPYEPRIATDEDLEEFGDDCHDDWNICQCDDEYFMRGSDECEANTRLIAAAPDLLTVCEMFARVAVQHGWNRNFPELWMAAQCAVSKATGKQI